jgi:hypothetical protein
VALILCIIVYSYLCMFNYELYYIMLSLVFEPFYEYFGVYDLLIL